MAFPSDIHVTYTLVDNTDDVLATHPNTLSSEITAIETKLGIDSSAVSSSIDYFLKNASGAYRIHTHDGTSDDGAQLDWDTCWSDAIHDHSSNAEGGTIPLTSLIDYPFKTGDWILSTVTTARTGWNNVSSTYSNKFMRINATPLTTGGGDNHTHGAGSYAAASHQHSLGSGTSIPSPGFDPAAYSSATTSVGASVSGTSASADNIPAYVQVVVFQKS